MSVIAPTRLWSICKAFLSNDLRTVSDFLKLLKIMAAQIINSALTAAYFLVDRNSFGTLTIFFKPGNSPR